MCFIRIEQHKHSDCQSSTGESLYTVYLSVTLHLSVLLPLCLSISCALFPSVPLCIAHSERHRPLCPCSRSKPVFLLRAALALAVLPPYLALLARGWSSLVLSVRSPLTSLSTSPHRVSSPHCWAPHTKHRLIQTITVRSARKSDTFSNVKINPMFNC